MKGRYLGSKFCYWITKLHKKITSMVISHYISAQLQTNNSSFFFLIVVISWKQIAQWYGSSILLPRKTSPGPTDFPVNKQSADFLLVTPITPHAVRYSKGRNLLLHLTQRCQISLFFRVCREVFQIPDTAISPHGLKEFQPFTAREVL